ncbi:putative bifunctional diguanylate cyclase/phosphodiesterase [Gallaecimonas xiamenensis]|uniref:diguanylate cyclase n=1 Tax=Gallaecimonas xiamenensis 3-C-1 TaxID=745411 RepID=K2J5E6_9GAMM|nr:EAL domain-containing protein [Gallaecimonas xiamenensis]EKE70263.1 PAS/PAC sensor-containing diguanylate cyclase/phosphodiesterase [Gallaecimonas xiamenensis 3-C-1]
MKSTRAVLSLRWQLLVPFFCLLLLVFSAFVAINQGSVNKVYDGVRERTTLYRKQVFSAELLQQRTLSPWTLLCGESQCRLQSAGNDLDLQALSRLLQADVLVVERAGNRLLAASGETQPKIRAHCLSEGQCDLGGLWLVSLFEDDGKVLMAQLDGRNMLADKNQALVSTLVFGLGGLVVCLFIFYLLLRRPLERLTAISDAVPLLAKGAYEGFRARLRTIGRHQKLLDEPTLLAQRLEEMSLQLESMDCQHQKRAGELQWLASHDVLTGLVNRRQFELELQELLKRQQVVSLLFMDLDNFKFVNDVAGHKVGDRLLVRVAKVLQQLMPDNACVARFGGDEFAVLVPGLSLGGEESLLERLYHALREVRVSGGGQLHSPSVSIGLARLPEDGEDIDDVMARVDMAMYKAKEQGKNRYVRALTQESDQELGKHLYWLEKSKHGINTSNLCLYFQPIVDTESREVAHYETLLRARDRDGAWVSPVEFIRAAEQTGRTTELDLWVFRKLLDLMDKLPVDKLVRFSVNLSPKTFGELDAIAQIAHELQSKSELARRLIIEITETAALTNLDQARRSIQQLKMLGCHFALDDFGVGYSSFHTLKTLPVDFIKIDGSFIRGLASQHADSIFVRALVDIASQFGYRTIAEFVEDEEVAELLDILQVSYMQGYLFGKPQPAQTLWPDMAVA